MVRQTTLSVHLYRRRSNQNLLWIGHGCFGVDGGLSCSGVLMNFCSSCSIKLTSVKDENSNCQMRDYLMSSSKLIASMAIILSNGCASHLVLGFVTWSWLLGFYSCQSWLLSIENSENSSAWVSQIPFEIPHSAIPQNIRQDVCASLHKIVLYNLMLTWPCSLP